MWKNSFFRAYLSCFCSSILQYSVCKIILLMKYCVNYLVWSILPFICCSWKELVAVLIVLLTNFNTSRKNVFFAKYVFIHALPDDSVMSLATDLTTNSYLVSFTLQMTERWSDHFIFVFKVSISLQDAYYLANICRTQSSVLYSTEQKAV